MWKCESFTPTRRQALKMSRAMLTLQTLACDLEVPVVALSNLPRDLEAREDKRPRLSDFASVGLPTAAAHRFVAVYRECYYVREPLGRWSEPDPASDIPWWEPLELLVWEPKALGTDVHVVPFHPPSGRLRLG